MLRIACLCIGSAVLDSGARKAIVMQISNQREIPSSSVDIGVNVLMRNKFRLILLTLTMCGVVI